MSFSGYLVKCGSMTQEQITQFHSFIVDESYHVSKKPLDLDPERDGNGILQRNVLDHVPYTVNFTIRRINNTQLQEFMDFIRNNYTVAKERKLSLTFYNPEDDGYVTQDVYLADPDFNIERIDRDTNEVYFKQTQIKFIGY